MQEQTQARKGEMMSGTFPSVTIKGRGHGGLRCHEAGRGQWLQTLLRSPIPALRPNHLSFVPKISVCVCVSWSEGYLASVGENNHPWPQ